MKKYEIDQDTNKNSKYQVGYIEGNCPEREFAVMHGHGNYFEIVLEYMTYMDAVNLMMRLRKCE